VTKSLIESAHHEKIRVHAWTVNDPGEISGFRTLGVDGIFTDFPERCLTPAS